MGKSANRKQPLKKTFRGKFPLLLIIFVLLVITGVIVYLVISSSPEKNPTATTLPLNVNQLIATRPDHANPHAITFCDPPLSYSWGQHGTEDSQYKHLDSWTLGAWYAIHRDCSILNTTLNARFNIRRIAIWNHQPSTNSWVKTYDGLPHWNVNTDPSYSSYADNAPQIESDGSYSFAFPPGRSLHGAEGDWPHINEGDGVITIIEARLLGTPSDIAAAKVGATAGADYRDANATGGDSNPGYYQSGFGQISLLNGNWQTYYMVSSTLTDAQILANPPSDFSQISLTSLSSPTPIPTAVPTTGAFTAQYFNNMTVSGTPVVTNAINATNLKFNWNSQSPAAGVNTSGWSASYTGNFNFDAAKYRFNATADDGVRIFVDGQKVFDGWKDQPATSYSGLKILTAGMHTVRVDYYQNLYNDSLQVNWVHANTCYDVTGDNLVSLADLNVLAKYFTQHVQNSPYDLDNDGVISILDLTKMSSQYGKTCS